MNDEVLKALVWSFELARLAIHGQPEGPNGTQLASLAKVEALIVEAQEQLAAKG